MRFGPLGSQMAVELNTQQAAREGIMDRAEKLARVGALRDSALQLFSRDFEGRVVPPFKGPVFWKTVGELKLMLRTPLAGVPRFCKSYGLVVWAEQKVLNLEWTPNDEIMIVNFHPGDWEKDLLKAVAA